MSKSGIPNFDTPKKARIKGAAEFMDAMGIPYYHTDLFNFHNVSNQQGWAILKQKGPEHDRTHHNDPTTEEKCGRKPKLSPKDLERCDRFLQDAAWDAHVLTWAQLAEELDLGVCGNTLRSHLGSMDYHKCIACTKGWVSQKNAAKRVEHCETMLSLKLDKESWHDVRFLDEIHCRVGP
jgi:hypothetical protein